MPTLLQNIFLGISLAAPIGPANIAVIKKGFSKGFISAFLVGLGVITADTFYLILVYFGLSLFLNIPSIQTIIYILGAIILLYMGYGSIKEFFQEIKLDDQKSYKHNSFVEGFLINVSNPIAIVWWTGVFGATLTEALKTSSEKIQVLFNGATIVVGLLIWVFIIALLTHWGKRFLNEKSLKYISLVAGILLVSFGLKFGFSAIISITSHFT